MIRRTDYTAAAAALLLALGAWDIASGGPAWAADTIETTADQPNPDFSSARDLVDAGKYDDALMALRALDAESPDNPDVLNLIGFSLRKTGHMDEALSFYDRALALKPDHLGANEYLGELYLELKQPDKARERLAVLRTACNGCEEFRDLEAKIGQAAQMQ